MSAAILLNRLTKRYGSRLAVDELSFEVQPGEVFGFVGPNGAGKTTTLRILAGLLQATSGQALIYDQDCQRRPAAAHRLLGYMPDFFGVYPDLKVWEYMDFFAGCYYIPPEKRPALIDGLLDPVDLLSRGMKQRLSLARALIHDPQVLLLDEPASGLDPRARVEIRELLVELARMGKTVFFSTHILADVAEICTRVAILEGGRLAALGTLEELHSQLMPRRRVEVIFMVQPQEQGLNHTAESIQNLLASQPGVLGVDDKEETGLRRSLAFDFLGEDSELSAVLQTLLAAGLPVVDFHEDQRDLEEVFLRATQANRHSQAD